MHTSVLIALITAISVAVPTMYSNKKSNDALIRVKKLELDHAYRMRQYEIFQQHYIEYVNSIFELEKNQDEIAAYEFRRCDAIMMTYADFIHSDILEKIEYRLSEGDFDEVYDLLRKLETQIQLFQNIN